MNWARKPGWRIAANDRFADGEASAGPDLESLMRKPSFGKSRRNRKKAARPGCTELRFGEQTPGRKPGFGPAQARLHKHIPGRHNPMPSLAQIGRGVLVEP